MCKQSPNGRLYWLGKNNTYEALSEELFGYLNTSADPEDAHPDGEPIPDKHVIHGMKTVWLLNRVFVDMLVECVPLIIGMKVWKLRCRNYQGVYTRMVAITDEALAIWYLDCYWNDLVIDDFEELLQCSNGHWLHKDRPTKPWFISGDKRRNHGVTPLGMERWNHWVGQVKKMRKNEQVMTKLAPCFQDACARRWGEYMRRAESANGIGAGNVIAANGFSSDEEEDS